MDKPRLEVVAARELYVNHFETCPFASEFSSKKGKR